MLKLPSKILLFLGCFCVQFFILLPVGKAQTDTLQVADTVKKKEVSKEKIPLRLEGLRIGTDAGYPAWMIFEPDDLRAELSLQLNFGNRLFPSLEAGYSSIRSVQSPNRFEYINTGFYVRAGLDYNLLYRILKDEALFVGLHYGQAQFQHEITYLINDAYFGIRDVDFNGTPDYLRQLSEDGMNLSWVEATLGMNVRVWKRFHAGYRFRFQFRLQTQDGELMQATSVPGFNKTNNGFNIGFGYHIWYQLPF